jgi:hypothetical protein
VGAETRVETVITPTPRKRDYPAYTEPLEVVKGEASMQCGAFKTTFDIRMGRGGIVFHARVTSQNGLYVIAIAKGEATIF